MFSGIISKPVIPYIRLTHQIVLSFTGSRIALITKPYRFKSILKSRHMNFNLNPIGNQIKNKISELNNTFIAKISPKHYGQDLKWSSIF